MARGKFTKPPLALQGRDIQSTLKKSFWSKRHSHIWTFLCPLCRTQRKVPFRPRPGGIRQISQVALTSIFFTICTWPWLSWKGIVSFLPFWSVYEFIYRWRMRAALPCQQCGFDPYLFLIDEEWAKKEVEQHWRKKFADHGIPYPEKSDPKDDKTGNPGQVKNSTVGQPSGAPASGEAAPPSKTP